MRKFLLIAISLFSLAIFELSAQKTSAYEGTYFIVGFMQNETTIDSYYGGLFLRLFISSTQNASIIIVIPRGNQIYDTIKTSVSKNRVLIYDLPTRLENRDSEIPVKKTVEIFSDIPVTVYAFNTQYLTGDCYSVIPVSHWGNEYISLNYPNDQYNLPNDPNRAIGPLDSISLLEVRKNQFMIMAAYNNTEVEIIPKAITTRGKQINRSYKIQLSKGDCYLVQSLGSQKGTSDLTGSIVRSNKPIGFLSGHVRTAIPQNIERDSKNHLCEMLMPTDSWGRKFITVPFGVNQYGDLIRITNIKPNTKVTIRYGNEIKTANLSEVGSFLDFAPIGQPAIITSDYPIQVGQYMMHTDNPDDSPYYDPCFVVIPPLEQYVSNIVFETPGNIINISSTSREEQFAGHAIAIIADKLAIQTLTLDDVYVKNITPIESRQIGDYHWTRINLKPGTHHLKADSGSFSGIIYGYGRADAYAMVLGSSLSNPFKKDTLAPEIITSEECGNIRGSVREPLDSNTSGFDIFYVITDLTYNYKWRIDKITPGKNELFFDAKPIDMLQDGRFAIEVRDKIGNGTRYIFNYKALKLSFPRDIHFGDVDYMDSLCYKFKIINTGDSIDILSASISKDERVRFQILEPIPRLLRRNDTLNVIVCFEPRGDTTALNSMLKIAINCERFIQIPLKAIVSTRSLLTSGYDFGKVRVGDTACSFILVINNGNRPIKLNNLEFDNKIQYLSYDTSGFLPKILYPSDTLKIPVCFSPLERGHYRSEFKFINDNGIDNLASISGQGIAPEINSIVIDWGKLRVGTNNDTIIKLTNIGEIATLVKFDNMIIADANFSISGLTSFESIIQPDSSEFINVSYNPQNTSSHHSISRLISDWKLHKPIDIELIGEGIIPSIETDDIYLGRIPVFSSIDTTPIIIRSKGSEALTIDSIIITQTNPAIDINLDNTNNLILQPNEIYQSQIKFKPQTTGIHQIYLDIFSDAAPNYKKVINRVRIWGEAFPLDTIEAEMKIFIPNKIIYCQKSRINIILQNTGNVKLKLTNLILNKGNNYAEWSQAINLPIEVAADSILSFGLDFLPELGQDGLMSVQAIFNDTIVKKGNIIIKPVFNDLTILNPEDLKANPGDTISIRINGKFPNKTNAPTDFSLNLNIKENAFILLNTSKLKLTSNFQNELLDVSSIQTPNEIKIKSQNKFLVEYDDTEWEVELKFLVLLSETSSHKVTIEANSKDCFKPGFKDIFANVTEVCAYSVRSIELIHNIPIIEIYPNPASAFLTIDVTTQQKERIEFKLFDHSGKKCFDNKIFDLEKGFYSINFEISQFSEGLYLLIISNKNFIKRKLFIISK